MNIYYNAAKNDLIELINDKRVKDNKEVISLSTLIDIFENFREDYYLVSERKNLVYNFNQRNLYTKISRYLNELDDLKISYTLINAKKNQANFNFTIDNEKESDNDNYNQLVSTLCDGKLENEIVLNKFVKQFSTKERLYIEKYIMKYTKLIELYLQKVIKLSNYLDTDIKENRLKIFNDKIIEKEVTPNIGFKYSLENIVMSKPYRLKLLTSGEAGLNKDFFGTARFMYDNESIITKNIPVEISTLPNLYQDIIRERRRK